MAGSVAMYFRQQRYPPPRLISYKIAGIRTLWEDVVPLCRLSITPCAGSESGALCAQFTQRPMTTGSYLVACPALGEREIVYGCEAAADICYSMHEESGSYAFVEDWLGHTYMEYGECV